MSQGDLFDNLPEPEEEKPTARRQAPPETAPEPELEFAPEPEPEPVPEPEAEPEPAPEPAPAIEADAELELPAPEPEETVAARRHTPLPPAGTLGRILAELRRAKGLTVDDVANETLIKPSYLEALEEDRFSELPHMVYVLAYVKKLCALYDVSGADTEELVSGLREQLAYEIPEDIDKSVICREQDEETRRKLQQITVALIAGAALIVLLLIAGTAALILRSQRGSASEPTETQLSEEWLTANRGGMVLKTTAVDEAPPAPRRRR